MSPGALSPGRALRQTWLDGLAGLGEAGLDGLAAARELLEGLEAHLRRPPRELDGADPGVSETFAACLADLRHLAVRLHQLPGEHADDALGPAAQKLTAAAPAWAGQLGEIALEMEAMLEAATDGAPTASSEPAPALAPAATSEPG